MGKITSNVSAAKEAVSGFEKIEKPDFKKINLGQSNVQGMKNALELSEMLGKTVNGLLDVTKKQAEKIVKLAEKKEQDDKNDSSIFGSHVSGGSGGGRGFDNTKVKDSWIKVGQNVSENAGVYFKETDKNSPAYSVDFGKVIENISGGMVGAYGTIAPNINPNPIPPKRENHTEEVINNIGQGYDTALENSNGYQNDNYQTSPYGKGGTPNEQ
ncbi:hypothetical protein [Lactococcus allomyrinae]|uniref:Uncharacterized protein n=1 Tax=Lactococcus allomyrinae TaxID=2419773 RepID=A0A387BE18_9LACT|nr:hypothetical protein [Lactococcus allomyrinae]AYF99848.1 hypothetical protein D7I46_01365 [Lactococcus allomyrinae]